jgi:hypothetical protein
MHPESDTGAAQENLCKTRGPALGMTAACRTARVIRLGGCMLTAHALCRIPVTDRQNGVTRSSVAGFDSRCQKVLIRQPASTVLRNRHTTDPESECGMFCLIC